MSADLQRYLNLKITFKKSITRNSEKKKTTRLRLSSHSLEIESGIWILTNKVRNKETNE